MNQTVLNYIERRIEERTNFMGIVFKERKGNELLFNARMSVYPYKAKLLVKKERKNFYSLSYATGASNSYVSLCEF